MSDAPLKVCTNCMGPLRKMIYPAGIIFKGSGYYTTDYKSAGSPSRHGDSDGAAPKSEGGTDGGSSSTDTKSDSKSEPKSHSKSSPKSDTKAAPKEAAKPSPTAKPAAKDGVS